MLSRWFATGFLALLTACGGGSVLEVAEPGRLPLQTAVHAIQAPIVDLGRSVHIGADVAAPSGDLPNVAIHVDARVSHGTIRDGVGAAELIAYLQADARSYPGSDDAEGADVRLLPDGLLIRFAALPPTVRVAEGTPAELIDETVRTVQAINAALPREWQLRFSPDPAPAGTSEPPAGEILVTFAPEAEWTVDARSPAGNQVGAAEPQFRLIPTGDPEAPFSIEIIGGRVWLDPSQTGGLERLGVIAHELIHLLGRNHVDANRFPETLLVAGGSEALTPHILHPLDREALLAVYGRFDRSTAPADIAEALGPWSSTSSQVRGALGIGDGEIAFGAALRNGLSQPWAAGPAPDSRLGDNAALSGSARWSGRLLGLTPDAATVAGAARLTVDLTALSGSLDFSGLEIWPVDAPPGAPGSGAAWRAGRLSYRIGLRGNGFVQTGGDAGQVTGAFFGPSHEGMGGILVRDDLSAGFGGKR